MQWTVAREFRRRMKKRFDELGIEIPFPQRVLHLADALPTAAPDVRTTLAAKAAETAPEPEATPETRTLAAKLSDAKTTKDRSRP